MRLSGVSRILCSREKWFVPTSKKPVGASYAHHETRDWKEFIRLS